MTATMSLDAKNRMAYLADTVDRLFPGINGGGPVGPMTVVPSTRAPRLLVPVRSRRAAAAAVRRYTAQQGPRERVAGLALVAGIRAGLCDRLEQVRSTVPHAESICEHLARVMGRPVDTALALTHQRPNRKPVLQVFDEHGRTVAFAKVGVSPLAARLVEAEAAALAAVSDAGLRHVEVARVLHFGHWHQMPVLVTSPLPLRRAPRSNSDVLVKAMRDVSAVTTSGDAADYLNALAARAAQAGSAAARWQEVCDELIAARDLGTIRFGAWHGDFTEWNCARSGARLAVWDWERFAVPAPLGFDRLHYVLNHHVRARRDAFSAAAERIVATSPAALAPWGTTADAAVTTSLLYLLDIALRYVSDDLRSSDPGGRVEEWAFPVIRANLARGGS
jgi:hypothetical protein